MKKEYKTIKNTAQAELIERRSRFIATIKPVSCEEEALSLIEAARSKYHDATHNVYAYIISDNNICRYSDDGEPSGTAGIPVLDVLRKEGLTDVAVVVTRYFGGILLGGGGLVRAYGSSAKLGVDAGVVITKILCDVVKITTDYQTFGKVQYETLGKGYTVKDTVYEGNVSLYVLCPTDETESYIKHINDVTNARMSYEIVSQEYLDKE